MKAWFYALLRKLVYVVARTPTSGLRCALYRFFFKYQIIDTYIGYGTEIYVESFHCERARLGENNRFRGSMRVFISPDVTVASGNVFDCGDWAKDKDPAGTERYARTLIFSEGVKVSHDHFFDVVGHPKLAPIHGLLGAVPSSGRMAPATNYAPYTSAQTAMLAVPCASRRAAESGIVAWSAWDLWSRGNLLIRIA